MGTTAAIDADAASAVMLPAVVTLQPLDPARLPLFAGLWQFYLYEASGRDALELDADGRFDWDEALFTGIAHGDGGEHDADAWLIECEGQVAGLLVTMQVQLAGAPIREFADLYVLPRFRGRGVASAVIQQVIIEGDWMPGWSRCSATIPMPWRSGSARSCACRSWRGGTWSRRSYRTSTYSSSAPQRRGRADAAAPAARRPCIRSHENGRPMRGRPFLLHAALDGLKAWTRVRPSPRPASRSRQPGTRSASPA